jgi:diadenosine tetraphosphatase ApaH/serine/threonine PP2A family protein phosphatase
VIEQFARPLKIPAEGLVFDLVWSDPNPHDTDFGRSSRNAMTYGTDVTDVFLGNNDLSKRDSVRQCAGGSDIRPPFEVFVRDE